MQNRMLHSQGQAHELANLQSGARKRQWSSGPLVQSSGPHYMCRQELHL